MEGGYVSTSVSHAGGSWSMALAAASRIFIASARLPVVLRQATSHFSPPSAIGRMAFSIGQLLIG
jgi:hypothetical protein